MQITRTSVVRWVRVKMKRSGPGVVEQLWGQALISKGIDPWRSTL